MSLGLLLLWIILLDYSHHTQISVLAKRTCNPLCQYLRNTLLKGDNEIPKESRITAKRVKNRKKNTLLV